MKPQMSLPGIKTSCRNFTSLQAHSYSGFYHKWKKNSNYHNLLFREKSLFLQSSQHFKQSLSQSNIPFHNQPLNVTSKATYSVYHTTRPPIVHLYLSSNWWHLRFSLLTLCVLQMTILLLLITWQQLARQLSDALPIHCEVQEWRWNCHFCQEQRTKHSPTKKERNDEPMVKETSGHRVVGVRLVLLFLFLNWTYLLLVAQMKMITLVSLV